MFPINTATAVHAVKEAGVDLKKRYLKGLDVAYSSAMWRKPEVPTFEQEMDSDA